MANFKVVVSDPKSRKAFQKEIEQKASGFIGKRISDKVKGDALGLAGYEFQITGGSDAQGFPMRRDVEGIARKRLLLSIGPGFHPETRGQRKRKSVRGNTISSETSQVNAKVVTYGSKPLEQLIGEKKKEKLTEEEKKEKLKKEVESMLDKKAPEKSRSEQILEEQAKAEKAPKEGESKAESADKTEEKPEGKPVEGAKPEEKKGEAKEKPPEEPEKKPETAGEESKPEKAEARKEKK
jgi:small subunit ribosomal protein S6e